MKNLYSCSNCFELKVVRNSEGKILVKCFKELWVRKYDWCWKRDGSQVFVSNWAMNKAKECKDFDSGGEWDNG